MLVAMLLLLLLLLLAAVIPATTRLVSVSVTSYKAPRKTKNGPKLCALDLANETMSSDRQQCSYKCAGDATCAGYNIRNSLTHSPVMTSIHLYLLQHQELTHSLTCDDINTPVLATTSGTRLHATCTIISPSSLLWWQTACSTRLACYRFKFSTLS